MEEYSSKNRPVVSVIGMGYVGLCLSAGLSKFGTKVYCYDIDPTIIQALKNKETPIHEPKLPELLSKGLEQKVLIPTNDIKTAIMKSTVTFICVGTPCDETGYIDLSNIKNVSKVIGQILRDKDDYHVVSIKSTVIPGTTDTHMIPLIEKYSGKRAGSDFGACMTPEFLKEGAAIDDFLNPDKIVIGSYDKKSSDLMYKVWQDFWPSKIEKDIFVFCDLRTAEMIKYANNSFLATKISFINELANLAEIFGVDIKIVSKAIGMDKRISPYFLNAGLGFGGSCFPKDVKALYSAGKQAGYDPKLLNSVLEANKVQPFRPYHILKSVLKDLRGKRIAILGLSFKPNTDDVRSAPSLQITQKLLEENCFIQAYDPVATHNFKLAINAPDKDRIDYFSTYEEALKDTDAAIFTTEWEEFYEIDVDTFKKQMKNPLIIDGRRIFDPNMFKGSGIIYYGIGFSKSTKFAPK
ncbi:MAG: nucleotide sugar dehydrogenase [Candidatus Lokiarchaeota archaeon]|nr:nucleotide sugar dehydrogenase [Candidatus Lokiarchaeota archaeon]